MATNPVLAARRNVSSGDNGHYDIRLLELGVDALTIEVSQSIFFDFRPNELDSNIKWTADEREAFTDQFREQVADTWNQPDHVTIKGHSVSVRFTFEFRESASGSQWHIRVFKLKPGGDRLSAVSRGGVSDADLDSNDGRRKNLGAETTQTGIIHEFGHMIGLPDEYKGTSPHLKDRPSIMNWGSTVRERHLAHFVAWARPHINRLPAKGATMAEGKQGLPSFLVPGLKHDSAEVPEAVRNWKDGLVPGETVLWEVRRRDTHTPIPIEEVKPSDFDTLEIVFERIPGASEPVVWRPGSAEAVEALLEGS
jgi:hypothetical protein